MLNGEEIGPLSTTVLSQLARQGKITTETPIRPGSGQEWVQAGRVRGLQDHFVVAEDGSPDANPASHGTKRRRQKHFALPLTATLCVVGIGILAAVLSQPHRIEQAEIRDELPQGNPHLIDAEVRERDQAGKADVLHQNQIDAVEERIRVARELGDISAAELYDEFEDNEVAADQKYALRLVRIYGIVDSIGKDVHGAIYVSLRTARPTAVVQCFCTPDSGEVADVAALHKGDTVMVVGMNAGKLFSNVQLKDCRFVRLTE